LAEDGVYGESVYLYGEGWDFGEVTGNARFTQAIQGQLGGTGIGTFSDRLRDAVRGGSPFDEDPRAVQGFGSGSFTDPNAAAAGTPEEQAARLDHQSDLVRLGLAGNLADFSFPTSSGEVKSGSEIDYNGQPAGYAQEPEEVITYVDAHDNETLYDILAMKLPADTSMADRIRMNTLSLATTALSQTPSFWHAGADILRSKSLDRNSYNSGDHFNRIDWSLQDNNFGVGLPMAADNESKWPIMAPLLANPELQPEPKEIAHAGEMAQELLELRFSTDLFRLGSSELIQEKVTFPQAGADAAPGLIVMSIDDRTGTDVDPDLEGVLAVFNASPEPITRQIDGFAGRDFELSPVQASGVDEVVQRTTWSEDTGTVTIPGRTVAVLVDPEDDGGPAPEDGLADCDGTAESNGAADSSASAGSPGTAGQENTQDSNGYRSSEGTDAVEEKNGAADRNAGGELSTTGISLPVIVGLALLAILLGATILRLNRHRSAPMHASGR